MRRVLRAAALLILLALLPATAEAGFREDEVRVAAEARGFERIADRLAAASRPALFLVPVKPERPLAAAGSHFAGRPLIPLGTPWPRCKGRAQTFLAKLDLTTLPPEAWELGRLGGHLLVFTQVEFESDRRRPGYGLWAGDCTTVLHVPASTPVHRRGPPAGTQVLKMKRKAIRYLVRPDIPDTRLDTFRLMRPLGSINVRPRWEAYGDLRSDLQDVEDFHYVENKLLGYVESPNGGPRCYARAERDGWRHLFTMGPEYARFEVADAGRLQIAIRERDLLRGRFDRICGIFDSA